MSAPVLEGEAAAAVAHRGSHLQLIASAGSGKTEVVSQRVAQLLADGVASRGIVAFTFTEKAAAELKERIIERVAERLGRSAVDLLGGLFVGTMHAYCSACCNSTCLATSRSTCSTRTSSTPSWPARPSRSS